MHCENCRNADAPYQCSSCGFRFCAACVSLDDHEPRCWRCLVQYPVQYPGEEAGAGTWPIAKEWPDNAIAQMNGQWYVLAHVGDGRYVVIDGPFGTYQRAFLRGQEA